MAGRMKLKVAFYINGAPKLDAVIEMEKPDVPDGWRVVGPPLVRRVELSDGSVCELRWVTAKTRKFGPRKKDD
jgi:hypothetical protein